MIRINLLPVKEAQRVAGRQQLSTALLSASVVLLLMVVPYTIQSRRLSELESGIARTDAEIAKLNQQALEVKDLDKKRAELQAKLKVIQDLNQKRVGPVRVLEDLSSATPEKLWLVDFIDQSGQATITGMALDNQTIAVFMRQLQSSKYFCDVDLVEAAQSEPVRGGGGVTTAGIFKKFIVKARLDYLGNGGKIQPAPGRPAPGRPAPVRTGA